MNTKYLAKAGIIAALYVILVALEMVYPPLAYGMIQVRIAEALVLLPLVERAAIPGVFVGCLIANSILAITSGFGLIDIIGGSLVTLVAAYLTSKMPNKTLGILPPVLLNGIIVGIWVSHFLSTPYWMTAGAIALGELIAVGLFGNIVLLVYNRIQNN